MSKNFIYRVLMGLLLGVFLQACTPPMDGITQGKVYRYLSASQGRGVDVVVMGDGFTQEDLSNGVYDATMRQAAEHLFAVQPYLRYREYFNVYIVEAVSAESGVSDLDVTRDTRFGVRYTQPGSGTGMSVDTDACFDYARKAPIITDRTLVLLVANSTRYGGTCHMWTSGKAIAICPMPEHASPYDFAAVVQHEAGGHGFAKLADEYTGTGSIDAQEIKDVREWQWLGHYANISLSGDLQKVPWKDFLGRPGYELVGAFEGAHTFTYGVWRPENKSCMVNNIPYYNAPSRLAIVKRIHSLSGRVFLWTQFWEEDLKDAQNVPPEALGAFSTAEQTLFPPLAPPVWRD